jgi:hypothetical protein
MLRSELKHEARRKLAPCEKLTRIHGRWEGEIRILARFPQKSLARCLATRLNQQTREHQDAQQRIHAGR